MRKIFAGEFISLDGVMEAPETWHFPYFSDEMGQWVGESIAESDAMLLGRVTYEEFVKAWADKSDDDPMAASMNNTQKYVVSTTLQKVEWKNSTLISGNLAEEIGKLKQQPGKNISITGSAGLVRSLLRENLLDELRLLVHPIVVGKGKRLLTDELDQVPLKLVKQETFSTGVLALTYQAATG